MQPLLKISGVNKAFPGVQALQNACLSVYAGRVMALMGENGAGKSTLMKVLTGIYHKDSGSIEYLGKAVNFANPKQSQAAGISIIHQELNLADNLSIAENIFLGREFKTPWGAVDWRKTYAEADNLLQRLGMPHSSRQRCGELSIAERQMVEIAKALSFESQIIIMDEPTDALTETETATLFGMIRELKAEKRGIVYISHRLKEIFEICDDITVLRDGQFIGECAVADTSEDRLIEMMVGRRLDEQYPYQPPSQLVPLLSVENLSGSGVQDVSFQLNAGEVVGIGGLVGAGRTELAKVLYGALPKSGGKVRLKNRTISICNPQQAMAQGMVYISEDRKGDGLILGMSVKENMSLTALGHFSHFGCLNHAAEKLAVTDFITLFNIKTPHANQPVGLLSGGNQQKIALAKGLMTRPQVLILDEPARGVDVGAKKEIYQLINEFKQQGLSILLISSDMPELLGLSDRILVMRNGRITAEFPRTTATQEAVLAAAIGKTTA